MRKNYLFENPEDYSFNENFVEFSEGKARLKLAEAEGTFVEPFANDTGFVYDSSKTEFVAGVLRQIDQRPAGATFGASYSSSVNGSWATTGSLTGTANNGASVSGGRLDLTGGGDRSVDYDGTGRIGTTTGTIRLRWTPNYNGTPTDQQTFFTIGETDENSQNSKMQLLHHPNGSLFLLVNDASGVNIYSNSLLTFNAVAGVESVIEVGWDTGAGKLYVFGEGFLLAELSDPFTHGACAFFRVGGDSGGDTNSYFDDVIVFDTLQNTANHDKNYTVPNNAYVASQAECPEVEYSAGGGSFIQATDFSTSETNAPRYTIQIGRSGNYLYWNGSAWATSNGTYAQANPAATFLAHVGTLPLDGEIYFQFKVLFDDSAVQQSITSLTFKINQSTLYSTDAQTITPNGRFEAAVLTSMLETVTTPPDTEVRYILEVDSLKKYWNGTKWASSIGSFAQSNTKQQIEDNCVALIDQSHFVKLLILLKTDDDVVTPDITSAALDFEEDPAGLRGYLNGILAFIEAESLTDEEFDSLPEDLDQSDDVAVYNALLDILNEREDVSDETARLTHYFQAKGAAVVEPPSAQSHILIGGGL